MTTLIFREARFEKLEIEKLHFEAGSFVLELLAFTLKTSLFKLPRSSKMELLESQYSRFKLTYKTWYWIRIKAAAAGRTL